MVKLERASKPTIISNSTKLLLSVILSVLITNIDAGPSRIKGISKCVSFCKESSKYEFEGQITNIYDYNTQISTSILGESTQQSNLYITSRVQISSIAPCELQLQVTNVKIDESQGEHLRAPVPGADELVKQLEAQPLRFSFQDGKIEHICAVDEDSIWVLNFKRGILSTLQNTMTNFTREETTHDVDVSGRCLTKYKPSLQTPNGNYFLQRHKDLKGCSQHHSHLSAFQSIPYTSNSPTQTIPLLTGSQVCSQTFIGKGLNHAECREVHLFQPFQNGGSSAQTVITQRLIFISKKDSLLLNSAFYRMKKTSLILETQGQSNSAQDTEISSILLLLETLELESFPKVQSGAPEHFIDLVQELRFINYDALKILLAQAPGKTGTQHLLDALPLVGTAPSMTLIRELYETGKLSEDQIDVWLTSMNFIKNPNIEMISAVRPLLDGEPRNQVLLSLSSLVHAYCKENDDCTGDNAVIEDILTKLITFLGTSCKVGGSNMEDLAAIVVPLKAIGNAGRLPSNDKQESFNTLKKCFEDKSNPTEIRLAALDAFRRLPCRSYKHDSIVVLFTNIKEDTEVRIHAYLTTMKCPDRQLVKTVEGVLYTEAVNQVGSFVWTHLTNLQETSSPDKQALKELVSNNFLQNKFSTDMRKYSRNYEGAMYWEEENVGVGVDSNVVFVPDSFIPRSAMMNLTCHLFGESVNLVEFGARVHSLEHLLEPLFGPDGYFPDQTVNEALHTMRVKRDAFSSDIRRLDTVYSQASYGSEHLPGGSIYTRVFGNELIYKKFEISHKTAAPTLIDETGKNWLDITHLFDNLRTGKSTEFTKSTVLIDASYSVSTSAGIPLSIAVQSAATVALSANGKLDISKFWDKNELEIQGMLRPSAAVQVHGTLSVQLGKLDSKIKSGLKLQNTLHSSTASQARLMMKGKQIIHMSLTLPEDKQEVFETHSQLLLIHPSGRTEISVKNQNIIQQKICSPQVLSNALGIQFCRETNLPDNFTMSLFAPAFASIYIEKTDVFKSYELDYKWVDDDGKADIAIVFSTPGSKIDRRIAAEFRYDRNDGILETTIETPGKSFRADGKYKLNEQGLDILLTSDKKEVLHINTAIQHSGSRIKPNVLLSYFNNPILEAEGIIDLLGIGEPGGKANVELTLKHLTENPIHLNGDLIHNDETFDSNVAIQSYLISGNARSQFKIKSNLLSSKAELKYSWRQAEMQTINISSKIQKTKKGSLSRYSTSASYFSSHSPDSHGEIEWETQTSSRYCENTMKYSWGKSRWEGKVLYNRQTSREHHDIHFQVSLVAPREDVDYNLEFSHQFNVTGISTKFNVRINPRNELNAQLQYLTEIEPLSKKSFISELSWPSRKYSIKAFSTEIRKGEFESEITIIPNRGEEMKGTLIYRNVATNLALEQALQFRLRGFLSTALSGSGSLSVSEKLRHLGGQFNIEGNEYYSGKWSTSLDYSLVKKNSKKIEGKLSLNENKYNVLLNWRQAKNGDRVGTLDMQLPRHIRLEGQIKGSLPEKITGSLVLYPDRDTSPGSKMGIKSTMDTTSAVISVDYYGQVANLSSTFADSRIEIGAEWAKNMLFNLTIVARDLEFENTDFSINLETSIDGFTNAGFNIRHRITGDSQLDTEINSQIEGKKAVIAIRGILTSSEYRGGVTVDISQLSKFEGAINLAKNRDFTSFEITGSLGDQSTSFKIENKRLLRGYNFTIDFSGCSEAPQVYFNLKHQKLEETSTNLLLEWTSGNSNRRQVKVDIVAGSQPWNYKFLFKSPFKRMEKLDGSLSWKTNMTNSKLDLNLDLPLIPMMPMRLTGDMYFENYNFKHDVALAWYSRNRMKTITGKTEGKISGLKDLLLLTSVKIPDHTYEINLQRNKDNKHQTTRLELAYDKDRATFETNCHHEITSKFVKISSYVSAEWPSQPKLDLHFDYNRNEEKTTLLTYATEGQSILAKLTAHSQYKSWRFWDVSAILESPLEGFPIGSIQSKNIMLYKVDKIHHLSQISITPKFFKFRNGEESKHLFLKFDIINTEDILGTIRLNQNEIQLNGKLTLSPSTRKIDLKITSTLFDTLNTRVEYQKVSTNGASISISAHVKDVSILRLTSEGKYDENKIFADLDFNWRSGPRMQTKIELDFKEIALEIILKENEQYLISIVASAQIRQSRGNLALDIQSKFIPQLDKFKIDFKYQFEADKFTLNGKYVNKETEASITGSGVFNDETRKFQLVIDGPKKIITEIELLDWSKLTASVSVDNSKMFGFDMIHKLEKGEYTFGKHVLTIDIYTGNSYTIVTTFAMDFDQAIITLNTPFKGWKEFKISSKFKFEPSAKSISVIAESGSVEYKLNFQSQSNSKTGNILIQIETPINGFKNGSIKAKYSHEQNIENAITLSLEDQTISMIANWTPSKAELKIETPFEALKIVSVCGEYKSQESSKLLRLSLSYNELKYEMESSVRFSPGKCDVNFSLSGARKYNMEISYDISIDYIGKVVLSNAGKMYKFGGYVILGNDDVQFEIYSPISGWENISGKVKYSESNNREKVVIIEWNFNGEIERADFRILIEIGKLQINGNTPFHPWNEVAVLVNYGTERTKRGLDLKLERGDGKYFKISSEIERVGGNFTELLMPMTVLFRLEISSNLTGVENFKVNGKYNRQRENHEISASCDIFGEVLEGKAKIQIERSQGFHIDIAAEAAIPLFGIRQTKLTAFLHANLNRESTFKVEINHNGKHHMAESTFKISQTQIQLRAQSTFQALTHLVVSGQYRSDGRIDTVLQFNEKRLEGKGQVLWGGLSHTKIVFDVTSPFEGFKLTHLLADSNFASNRGMASFTLQNDHVRYMAKADGLILPTSGHLTLQINSPIHKLEQVLTSVQYNISGIRIRLDRNTIEELNAQLLLINDELQINLFSKIPGYQVDSKSSLNWGKGSLGGKLNFNASFFGQKVSVVTSIESIRSFGLEIDTSIRDYEQLTLNYNLDGNLGSGNVKASYKIPKLGQKSVRASWRKDDNKYLKAELWLNGTNFRNEKGFAFQYTLAPGLSRSGKFAGSLTYILDKIEQELKLTTSLKREGNLNKFDFTFRSPFKPIKEIDISGKLLLNPEVALDILIQYNQIKLLSSNVNILLSPSISKLKLSFNAPFICDPFSFNAAYDLTTIDKTLEISFLQNEYQITVKTLAVVPQNSQEIELRMTVDSNVPSVTVSASGMLKASYKVEHDGNRQFSLAIDSEQTGNWKVITSIRPFGNLHLKVGLDSPIQDIVPSVQVEALWTGNFKEGVNGEFVLRIRKQDELKATLRSGPHKFSTTFKSNIAGFENLSLEGKFDSSNGYKANVDIMAAKGRVTLTMELTLLSSSSSGHGSIELKSTWQQIPSGSLDVILAEDGALEMKGIWGERNVGVRGNIKRESHASLLKSGDIDLTFILDSQEQFKIQSKHYFNQPEFSLNVTTGDYSFQSYFHNDPEVNIVSAAIQWEKVKIIQFYAETKFCQFKATINTPWSAELQTIGSYVLSEELHSAKGILIYDGVQSILEANVVTKSDSFNSLVNIDIPLLNQKLEAIININKPNEQFVEGDIKLNMVDRHLAVRGFLSSGQEMSSEIGKVEEKTLHLSILFPNSKHSDIKTEFVITKPVDGFASLKVDANIALPTGTTKAAFQYELPMYGSNKLNTEFSLNSPIISSEPISGSIYAEIYSVENVNATLKYGDNDLKISWKLGSEFATNIYASLPTIYEEFSPVSFAADGHFDFPNKLSLHVKAHSEKHSLKSETTFANLNGGFNAKVLIEAPTIFDEKQEYSLKLSKIGPTNYISEFTSRNGKSALIAIGELVLQEQDISLSGKVSGIYGAHFLQIVGSRNGNTYLGEINTESLSLLNGKKVVVSGRFDFLDNKGFEGNIECRTRKAVHSASIRALLSPEQGILSFKVNSPGITSPIMFNSEYKIDENIFSGKIEAHLAGKSQIIEGKLDKRNWDALVTIDCPLITHEYLKVHLKCSVEEKDVNLLVDVGVTGIHWKLEGTMRFATTDDIEVKLELITPLDDLERLTLAIKLDADEILFELHEPMGNVPSLIFSLTGFPLYEEFNWKNMKPEVIIGLTSVTYASKVVLQVPDETTPGEFRIMFEQNQTKKNEQKRFEVAVQMSELKTFNTNMDDSVLLKFEASTPFANYRSLQWELGGNMQWKNWAEIKLIGNLNDQKLSFITEIRADADNQKFLVELITPFKNWDRFTFIGRVGKFEEIGFGRSIQVEFYQPGWEKSINLEIDYNFRFEGFESMEGELSLKAPGMEIPPLILQLTSALKDSSYNAGIEGIWGEYRPSMKIGAGYRGNKLTATMELQSGIDKGYHGSVEFGLTNLRRDKSINCEVQINHEEIFAFKISFLNQLDLMEGELTLRTPFTTINSASTSFRLSSLNSRDSTTFEKIMKSLDVSIETSLNNKKLMHFELVNKNGRRSIVIQNPFQPISIAVSFDNQPMKLRVYSELCWDLLKPENSTVGFELNLDQRSGGNDLNFKLLAGEKGSLDLTVFHLLTIIKLEHNVKVKWNRPSKNESLELGFGLLLNDNINLGKEKYDIVVRLDTPWRSIELELYDEVGEIDFSRLVMIKWDALRNPFKRVGVRFTREKIISWRSVSEKQSLTIVHAGLPHDLTFTLQKSFANDEIQFTELTIQPNSFPHDQFTARISYADMKNEGIQVILILPSINLDINIIMRKQGSVSSMHISHMDMQGERHVLNVETINEPLVTLLDIQAGPEINVVPLFRFEYRPKEDIHTLNFKIAAIEFDANLEKRIPLARANLNFNYGRKLNFIAGLPHKKEAIIKLSRNEFGMNINEILMSLKLNASQILSSRIHWRPEIFTSISELSVKVPTKINGYLTTNIPKMLAQANEEIEERLELLDPGINRLINTLKEYTTEEFNTFSHEIDSFIDYLGTLPLNNTYIDIDIGYLAQTTLETIHLVSEKCTEILDNAADAVFQFTSQVYIQGKILRDKYYGKLEGTIMPLWEQGDATLLRIWNETLDKMSNSISKVQYVYETFTNIVEGNMEALEKQISTIEVFLKLKQLFREYSTWIEELPIQDYTGTIRDVFVQHIWHPLEHYSKPSFIVLNKVLEDGNLFALLDIPPLPYVKYVATKFTGAIAQIWKLVEAEQKIRDIFRNILHLVDSILQRHIPTASMVWDLKKGQIEYHQPLNLIDWEDFTQMPRMKVSQDDELDGRKITDFYHSFFDTLRTAKPFIDMNMRDILPPFGSHAIMAGDHHYYTFDKKYYRFSGECSYVLVADLLHQNFTMLVNYENKEGEIKKKSYSLVSGDKVIEFDTTTFKVTLQGRKVELPLEVGPTFVRRQPSGLEIFDSRGFQMRCTLSPSVCVLSVSGWYFGKLGGLLGTYDNEMTNDLRTPDGQISSDVANFAHSWRVGTNSYQCRMKNFVKNETKKIDVDGICGDLLLNPTSPFRPCFGTVDATEFMNMCMYDTHKNLNSGLRKESSCTAIAAYVLECQKHKIDLWVPPHCVRCKLEDGSAMTSGDNVTLETNGVLKPPSSSDIVILLEEAASLQKYNLNEIIGKLDFILQAEGMTKNRYAIVNYGGKGPHRTPHIRTIAQQVWVHNSLRKITQGHAMDGQGGGDLYDAIQYAATIGFRAGVSKVMVAVTADDENCGDNDRYPDALMLLMENDFRLHILTPKDFALRSFKKSEDGKDIFGVDINGVYNAKQNRRGTTESDKSMRRQVIISKDFCTPLVMESNGTIFNLKHLHQNSAKKFIDVWARRVAQASHPSECQQCDCVPDRNGGALILCNECVSPQLKKYIADWEKYDLGNTNYDEIPGDPYDTNY